MKANYNVLNILYGLLAQVVEHLTFNQVVRGSSPRWLRRETLYQSLIDGVFFCIIEMQQSFSLFYMLQIHREFRGFCETKNYKKRNHIFF